MPVTEMGTPSTVLTWLESTLMVITLSTILYMVSVAAIEKQKLSQNLPQGTYYYWQHLQLAEKSHDMASQINWLFAEYTIFSPSSLIPKESYIVRTSAHAGSRARRKPVLRGPEGVCDGNIL